MQGSNQRLRGAQTVLNSSGDKIMLPAGAFVKAIKKCYLPKDHAFGDYDEAVVTVAFSQYGMVLILRSELDWAL